MTISRSSLKASRLARRHTANWLRADPYYLGDEAYHYGQPTKANPFKDGTTDHADWVRGWNDAEFEYAAKRATP